MLKFLWVRTWRPVNPRARWYMAKGHFVALSGSRKSKFVKQRASKQREHCELGVRIRWEILVPPTRCSSNEMVPVGRSPAPHGFFLCIHYPPIYFVTWRKYPGRLLYVLQSYLMLLKVNFHSHQLIVYEISYYSTSNSRYLAYTKSIY